MNVVLRFVRFYNHQNQWWPLACVAVMSFVLWRFHSRQSLTILLSGYAIALAASFFLRYPLIRNFAKIERWLNHGSIAMLVAVFVARHYGHGYYAILAFAVYSALTLGVLFWCTSDEMFEMIDWLTFPTEFGRSPDEIYIVDRRKIPWPDEPQPVRCCLYKFRYDQNWHYGITGPITFSLADERTDGKSIEEIYAAFAGWYEEEDIGGLIQRQLDGEEES